MGEYKNTKEKTINITGTVNALVEKYFAMGFVRFSVIFLSGLLI